jgi:toxin ParE1/3/4
MKPPQIGRSRQPCGGFTIRPAARQDILDQFLYLIDQGASEAAERFIEAIEETIPRLMRQPHIGTPKRLKNPRLKGLRRWPVDGFEVIGIYYLHTEETLRVVRVLHGKRDVDEILAFHRDKTSKPSDFTDIESW